MIRRKREYHTSELIKTLAKVYKFDNIITSFKIKSFFKEYFDEALFSEIEKITIKDKKLTIKINSPLLKNDFQMRKSFYLKKILDNIDNLEITDIHII